MFKLSTKTQYGLRAVIYLAVNGKRFCSIKEISKAEGIPFDYLEKILSKLEKSGFIKSKKGVSGGYALARKPKAMGAGELVSVLEGGLALTKCSLGTAVCGRQGNCLAKKLWQKIQKAINQTLNSLTLADLL
jgi:Rrf2 family protein